MKNAKIICTIIGLALSALILSCASSGGSAEPTGGFSGGWMWGAFNDAASGGSSRITLVEDVEMIGSEPQMTYAITGEITSQYEYGYAGWYARPDDETLDKLQSAKSFSFKVLGDGNAYQVMISTSDIEDSCFHRTTFTTKKDQITTVTVKVGSLAQPDDWGIKKRFNQSLAEQMQWQTTNNGRPGTFKLKVWDIKLYD